MSRTLIAVAVLLFTYSSSGASPDVTPLVKRCAIAMPQPKYPEGARLRRITGLGHFKVRVRRSTGRVTQVTILRSTGNQLLDAAAIESLRQWRFRAGSLPPMKQVDPTDREAAPDEFLLDVPIHFQLERDGVITKT